jgi:hypothetical protein
MEPFGLQSAALPGDCEAAMSTAIASGRLAARGGVCDLRTVLQSKDKIGSIVKITILIIEVPESRASVQEVRAAHRRGIERWMGEQAGAGVLVACEVLETERVAHNGADPQPAGG